MDRPTDERANDLITPARPETHISVATDGSIEPSVVLIVPASVAGRRQHESTGTISSTPPSLARQAFTSVGSSAGWSGLGWDNEHEALMRPNG